MLLKDHKAYLGKGILSLEIIPPPRIVTIGKFVLGVVRIARETRQFLE
jgi:hypothetical protein